MSDLTRYRFDVELGNRGQWYATSPDVEGLLAIGYSLADCLSEIGPALERVALARQLGPGDELIQEGDL